MIYDPGLIEYEKCHAMQRDLVRLRKFNEIEDSLIVCEHPSVFTVGRTGNPANLYGGQEALQRFSASVITADRGGDITYHGPGQIVLYPIIDLSGYGKDMHAYLRMLEDAVISFLSMYDVCGTRVPGKTGVWVKGEKISFIGIAASNWVTYHGVSININNDLAPFAVMHPCGHKEVIITSLSKILGHEIVMQEAKQRASTSFCEVFGLHSTEAQAA